jgi:hypothetical protein
MRQGIAPPHGHGTSRIARGGGMGWSTPRVTLVHTLSGFDSLATRCMLDHMRHPLERCAVVEHGQRPQRDRKMSGEEPDCPEQDALEARDQPDVPGLDSHHPGARAHLAAKHRAKQGHDDQDDLGLSARSDRAGATPG